MCLSIAMERPDDVLASGFHKGFEWQVIHNRRGYRCGYVRIPNGHPWHGVDYDDIDADVHGGLTFAEDDKPCDKDGPDNAYWIGFDCAHAWDAPDPELPQRTDPNLFDPIFKLFGEGIGIGTAIRTTDYVRMECEKLCEQAASVAPGEAHPVVEQCKTSFEE